MDEQKPPRRPRIAGDIERTSFARRRTPVEGAPVYVDPASEVSASVLLVQHVDVLSDRVDSLGKSLHAWAQESVRHGEMIKALGSSVGSVVSYTEGLRTTSAATSTRLEHFFDREWKRHEQLMERFEKALDNVADRLTRLEQAVERLHSSDQALAARLTANEASVNSLDVRVTALERTSADAALTDAVATQTTRKHLTWARAGLIGIGGAVMWIVKELGLLG